MEFEETQICVLGPWSLIMVPEEALTLYKMRTVVFMDNSGDYRGQECPGRQ